jgi:hypothetical protein
MRISTHNDKYPVAVTQGEDSLASSRPLASIVGGNRVTLEILKSKVSCWLLLSAEALHPTEP